MFKKEYGIFKCICGRIFDNNQALRGHRCHCRVVLDGKGEDYEKRLSECIRKINFATRKRSEISLIKKREKEIKKQEDWESTEHFCERCGEPLPKDLKMVFGSGRFCSSRCARSSPVSEETKLKIRNSMIRRVGCTHKYCATCGKKLLKNNKSGYCINCIRNTDKYHEDRREAGRLAQKSMDARGVQHTWKSRNIQSYAEKFWMNVLINNNIHFEGPNKPIRKADGKNNYFLDFYIEKGNVKLDLEIDGKQHKNPENVKSDLTRDSYLTSIGYVVYRVEWNDINSDAGRSLMESKISRFIDFYKSIEDMRE